MIGDKETRCEHEGIECEPTLTCEHGCMCAACLEALDVVPNNDSHMGNVSDGHHTFNELYEHRMALTLALARLLPVHSWKSKEHNVNDEPMFDGYFIVGINLPTGVITYHYKLEHWEKFTSVRALAYAPKWDGAPPDVTPQRLMAFDPSPGFAKSVYRDERYSG